MDPTVFLALGRGKPVQTAYARELLGEVSVRPRAGHDGKFFFAQANDPFFLDPEVHAVVLDDPTYRGRRMLYPTIASGFGSFPPDVVVWTLLITNVLALAVGGVLGSLLARRVGAPAWLGLAVPLNIGLIYELEIDGAGVVAYVFCLAGLLALAHGERTWAAGWFSAAALGRETMLLFVLGVCLLLWLIERKFAWRLMLLPTAALALWSAYLWVRLSGISGQGGAPSNFAAPFQGLIEATQAWIASPRDLIMNVTIVVLVAAFTVLALKSRLAIAWGALPFVALVAVLSINVWREPFDFTRVLAPVITAAPFLLLTPRPGTVARTRIGTFEENDGSAPD
jgi:hypothetical protein